jgi:hypothetical protein
MFFGGIALLLVLVLGSIMSSRGAGREFKELFITFLLGVGGILALVVICLMIASWSSTAGLIFLVVAGLYIIDWVIKS